MRSCLCSGYPEHQREHYYYNLRFNFCFVNRANRAYRCYLPARFVAPNLGAGFGVLLLAGLVQLKFRLSLSIHDLQRFQFHHI